MGSHTDMTNRKPITERTPQSTAVVSENPLVNRVLQNRGIASGGELDYTLAGLLRPDSLKGLAEGVALIGEAITAGRRILVVGDYDCDGATATACMTEGLESLHAADVEYLIPDRKVHGYGLSPAIVELAAEREPDLIVTVDNGISSVAGVAAVHAMERDCKVVVTDHHLPPVGELPAADALINPSQPGCEFRSKAICGCGIAFYVVSALRQHLERLGWFNDARPKPSLAPLLDLVALGTVADVVPLDQNNRTFVAQGLARMNGGRIRPGLRALADVAGRTVGRLKASDLGFALGPRLNAAGRLEDMSIGVECLRARDPEQAASLAGQLDGFNRRRREVESDLVVAAQAHYDSLEALPMAIVMYEPEAHEGVVGLCASRLKERYHRPVFVFADTEETREAKAAGRPPERATIKGSARSIPGLHLKNLLDEVHAHHPDVLEKFGGHAMAAGMTLYADQLEDFRTAVEAITARHVDDTVLAKRFEVDVIDPDPQWLTLETARALEAAGPFGQGFPEPTFAGHFDIVEARVLKQAHLKMRLRPKGGGPVVDAIAFGCIENGVVPVDGELEAVWKLDVNEWQGRERLQLMVEHLQPPAPALAEEPATSADPEPAAERAVALAGENTPSLF